MSAFSAILAPPGSSLSESFSPSVQLIHGSSLQLIANVCDFLSNTPDNSFADVNPEEDYKKWADRDSCETYYFLLTSSTSTAPLCCVRTILDRTSERSSSNPRIVIDYTYTDVNSRGQGLAKQLISYILSLASVCSANTYVLALEESCPYWLETYNFVLEVNPRINARFNIFPDTHMLRLGSDKLDEGDERDLEMQVDFEEEVEDGRGDDAEEEEEGGEEEGGEHEDDRVRTSDSPATTTTNSSPAASAASSVQVAASEAVTTLIATIRSNNTPQTVAALRRIKQIISNALTNNTKYHTLKCANKIIAEEVLSVEGCFELLCECGWKVGDGDEFVLVFEGAEGLEAVVDALGE
jgi:hypothetical protein